MSSTIAKSARVRRTSQRHCAAGPVLPEDLVLWEILFRLSSKELLRCGAVCRSWRRLSRDAEFLLGHHRHQPSLPLVLFDNASLIKVPATVDVLDLRRPPAARRPVLGFSSNSECEKYYVHASCDGLLLLSRTYRLYYICNPATRQWRALPDVSNVAALYRHRPSGEYRILYKKSNSDGCSFLYYVLAVGSSSLEEQRCVGPLELPRFVTLDHENPPVLLHDCLHWYLDGGESKVIVFDTVDESFRWMPSPVAGYGTNLRQMDGTLCIHQLDRDTMTVQIWALEDYEMEVWSLKHTIQLPEVEMTKDFPDKTWEVMSDNGDMLVSGCNPSLLLHYDSKGKLVDKIKKDFVTPKVLRLSLKESLVRHVFFERKDGNRRAKLPGFFRGL
jgi:F-box interacting protein